MNRQAVTPTPTRIPLLVPQQGILQRKCACGQHAADGECERCGRERQNLQRKEVGRARPTGVPPIVQDVLGAPGQPLDTGARAFMESRFGRDFSTVRVHQGPRAEDSTRAVDAQAYTVGRSIVFGPQKYQPTTTAGRWLLAHELTHVVQQGGNHHRGGRALSIGDSEEAGEREADRVADRVAEGGERGQLPAISSVAPALQRVGLLENISRFFGGGTFSPEELQQYLAFLEKNNKIEDNFDSDNKARDIVRRFKIGEKDFAILPIPTRALLIEEMITGYSSSADQESVLDLLREAIVGERTFILKKVGVDKLRSALSGDRLKELNALIDQEEDEVALAGNWTAEGVMEIVFRHGDVRTIEFLIREGYKILSFVAAYDKWEYPDGRIEEVEIKGLRGNTCRAVDTFCSGPKEIRLRDTMPNTEASATLVHEVAHAETGASEVDARIEGEKFRVRHGIGPAESNYRKADGTINEEAIRKEVKASPHYNPVGRKRIGRRYEGEKEIKGWHLPVKKKAK